MTPINFPSWIIKPSSFSRSKSWRVEAKPQEDKGLSQDTAGCDRPKASIAGDTKASQTPTHSNTPSGILPYDVHQSSWHLVGDDTTKPGCKQKQGACKGVIYIGLQMR